MNTLELKRTLVHRISEIEDLEFLKAVKTILESKVQSQMMVLSPEQRYEIAESKKEIEQGLYLEKEELDKEFNKWVSE